MAKHDKHFSVLNTDAFDRRRFKEILDKSLTLQEIRDAAKLPMFEPLLGDLWATFFKMKPEVIIEAVHPLRVNKLIVEKVMSSKDFHAYRIYTRLDEVAATICTIKFANWLNEWLARNMEEDQELLEEIETVHDKHGEHATMNDDCCLVPAMDKVEGKLESLNDDNLQAGFRLMMEDTKRISEKFKLLVGGLRAGSGECALRKIPLHDQLALAEKLAFDKGIQDIADWAGRFKQIAYEKQKSKRSESVERMGVQLGSAIERVLPIELSLYTHPVVKIDFLRRFAEGALMQYEQDGREVLGKGPIVLCLDQSDSMSGLDSQSKGFALALMAIARQQRRDFCLILFSTRLQSFTYDKGKMRTVELMRVARTFLGGGTNYALALEAASLVIGESRFKQADVVFVTDGEDGLDESQLKSFLKKKREKDFNILSLVIGCSISGVEPFSDKVVHIHELIDEGTFSAFEL